MDNPRLIRILSSTTVQVFGIALIVFIATFSADETSGFRPIAYIAALVLTGVLGFWITQWVTHHHQRDDIGNQPGAGQ
jgi:uncharacterized membrane protein YdfJ with MMPL/SSD domain